MITTSDESIYDLLTISGQSYNIYFFTSKSHFPWIIFAMSQTHVLGLSRHHLTCCKPSLWHTLSRQSLPLLSADNVHSMDVPSSSSTHITNNDLETTLYWRLFFKRSLKGIFHDGHLSKTIHIIHLLLKTQLIIQTFKKNTYWIR